jgi:phage gp16-like protein
MKATDASLAQRNADLAKIHIGWKRLGMSEDEYRDLLQAMFGKRSAADLDAAGRKLLLERLRILGFAPRGQRPGQAHKPLAQDKASIERKIAWQLGQLGKPWGYAYGVARRIFPEIEKFEFLTAGQLGKVSGVLARTIRYKAK